MAKVRSPFDILMDSLPAALAANTHIPPDQVKVLLGEIKRLKKVVALQKIARIRQKLLAS